MIGGQKQILGGTKTSELRIRECRPKTQRSSSRIFTKPGVKTKRKSSSHYKREFRRILGKATKKGLYRKICKKNCSCLRILNFYAKFLRNLRRRSKKGPRLTTSAKSAKKLFLLTNSGVTTIILGVSGLELHFSGTKPVTFFVAQSSLGGHNFRLGGHKQ